MRVTVTHFATLSAMALLTATAQAGIVGVGKQSDGTLVGSIPKEAAAAVYQQGQGETQGVADDYTTLRKMVDGTNTMADNLYEHSAVTNIKPMKRLSPAKSGDQASQAQGAAKPSSLKAVDSEILNDAANSLFASKTYNTVQPRDEAQGQDPLSGALNAALKPFGTNLGRRRQARHHSARAQNDNVKDDEHQLFVTTSVPATINFVDENLYAAEEAAYGKAGQRRRSSEGNDSNPLATSGKSASKVDDSTVVARGKAADPFEQFAEGVNKVADGLIKFDKRNTVVPGIELLPGQGPAANKFLNDLKTNGTKVIAEAYEAQPFIRSVDVTQEKMQRRKRQD